MASAPPKPSSFSSVIEHTLSVPPPADTGRLFLHRRQICVWICLLPTLFIIFLLLFLNSLFTSSLITILGPTIPSFRLLHLNTTLTGINPIYDGESEGASYVSAASDVGILVSNEDDTAIQYSESLLSVSRAEDELSFGEALVFGFRQEARSSTKVRATAVVKDLYLSGKQVVEIEMGVLKDGMVMDVEWVMTADLVTAGKVFRKVPLTVACIKVNTSALSAGNQPQCKTKLLGM